MGKWFMKELSLAVRNRISKQGSEDYVLNREHAMINCSSKTSILLYAKKFRNTKMKNKYFKSQHSELRKKTQNASKVWISLVKVVMFNDSGKKGSKKWRISI